MSTGPKIDQAMLMAAGLGTRLQPFTGFLPKPLLPLMGVPMAQFGLDLLARAGVAKVVANIHHLPELASAGLARLDRGSAQLEISDESQLLLGSAGGIRKALPRFGGRAFFLLNSDVICEVDLARLEARHLELRRRHGVWMTLTVFGQGPAGGKYREIVMDPGRERMTALGELSEGKPYFVGVAVLETEALRLVPPEGPAEFVPTILLPALAAGKVGIHFASGEWQDVGSPELWLRAHLALIRALERGSLPEVWRNRIEETQTRIAPGVWVPRFHGVRMEGRDWRAPLYWNEASVGMEFAGHDRIPPKLGSGAVLYGPESFAGTALEWGIGFNGAWTPCPEVQSSSGPA